MSRFAKVALALALVLPLAAYVLGTVMAAEPAPADHQPIILQQTSAADSVTEAVEAPADEEAEAVPQP